MQAVLDCFHDWLEAGAGGASNWSVEPENHEGWRVSIDEGGSTFPASSCTVGVAQSFVHCCILSFPVVRARTIVPTSRWQVAACA